MLGIEVFLRDQDCILAVCPRDDDWLVVVYHSIHRLAEVFTCFGAGDCSHGNIRKVGLERV